MDVFKEVKERLTMKAVAELYGYSINRSGFCSCPFHNEKTPSVKLYKKGFKCFGCGEGGDMIYFVQKLFDLSPIDACKKLNDDFGLGIGNTPRGKSEISRYIRLKQRKDTLRDKENCALSIVTDYLNILHGYSIDYKPTNEDVLPDRRFMEYLSNYENTLELYDSLSEAKTIPFEEKEQYYADMESTIVSIIKKLQKAENEKHYQIMQTLAVNKNHTPSKYTRSRI